MSTKAKSKANAPSGKSARKTPKSSRKKKGKKNVEPTLELPPMTTTSQEDLDAGKELDKQNKDSSMPLSPHDSNKTPKSSSKAKNSRKSTKRAKPSPSEEKSSDNEEEKPRKKARKEKKAKATKDKARPIPHFEAEPFEHVLRSGGVQLNVKRDEKSSAVYGVEDVAVLRKHVTKYFNNKVGHVEAFLDQFEKRIDHDEELKACLRAMCSVDENGVALDEEHHTSRFMHQTVVSVMLSVAALQTRLIDILLERLPLLAHHESDQSNAKFEDSLARLILQKLRTIDDLRDATHFCNKILQVLSVCELPMKREIIDALPDMVDDTHHNTVAECLLEELENDAELVVPVFAAVSNLTLPPAVKTRVCVAIETKLSSARFDDLPVMVRSLLTQTTSDRLPGTLAHMRASLSDLYKQANAPSGVVLLLEAIRDGVRYNEEIGKVLLKQLDGGGEGRTPTTVLDVWLLLVLHSTGARRRRLVSVFRNAVSSGRLTVETLDAALRSFGQALQPYFRDILSLVGDMMCHSGADGSSSAAIGQAAEHCYQRLFVEFADSYSRQEVLGAIIQHVGASSAPEVSHALSTLAHMVADRSVAPILLKYLPFLEGLLDYMDLLKRENVREVYNVFTTLAYSTSVQNASSTGLRDTLRKLIHKQLGSTELDIKHLGIIGAVNCISALTPMKSDEKEEVDKEDDQSRPLEEDDEDEGDADAQEKMRVEEASQLLQDVVHSCEQNAIAVSSLYDELSISVPQLSREAIAWLVSHLEAFVGMFVGSMDEDDQADERMWYSISDEPTMAVHIFSHIANIESNAPSVLEFLASGARLYFTCEREQHGGLARARTMLTGPLCMFDVCGSNSDPSKLPESEVRKRCLAMFYAINYLREVCNAFAAEDEYRSATLNRIAHIVELEQRLEKWLQCCDGTFQLPSCDKRIVLKKSKKSKSSGGAKVAGKKRKLENSSDEADEEDSNDDGSNDDDNEDDNVERMVPQSSLQLVNQLRSYFREFDSTLFCVLSSKFTDLVSMNHALVIFADLHGKLHALFESKNATRSSLYTPSLRFQAKYRAELSQVYDALQPFIESCTAFAAHILRWLQNVHTDKDEDDDSVAKKSTARRASALQVNGEQALLYLNESTAALMAWSGLRTEENTNLFKTVLQRLSGDNSQTSKKKARNNAFVKFKELMVGIWTTVGLDVGVSSTQVLSSIAGDSPSLKSHVSRLCGDYLRATWKKVKPTHVKVLLECHIRGHENPLRELRKIASVELPRFIEQRDIVGSQLPSMSHSQAENSQAVNNGSRVFRALSKKELPTLYSTAMRELLQTFRNMKWSDQRSYEAALNDLEAVVAVFKDLLACTTSLGSLETRALPRVAVQYGTSMVDHFDKTVLPFLSKNWALGGETLVNVLTMVQKASQMLLTICEEAKDERDNSIARLAPRTKKTIEHLGFSLQSVLGSHGCLNSVKIDAIQLDLPAKRYDSSSEEESEVIEDNDVNEKMDVVVDSSEESTKETVPKRKRQKVDVEVVNTLVSQSV